MIEFQAEMILDFPRPALNDPGGMVERLRRSVATRRRDAPERCADGSSTDDPPIGSGRVHHERILL